MSRTLRRYAPLSGPVAQLVEQLTFNQLVTGSNPVGLTIFHPLEAHPRIYDLADDLGSAAQLVGLQMRVALGHRG